MAGLTQVLLRRPAKERLADIVFYACICLVAVGLKNHYSQAGSVELLWILQPTVWLVELFSGTAFMHEPGYGYVRLDHSFVIAPACAGVNFLIAAFCMSGVYGVGQRSTVGDGICIMLVCLLLSYSMTVLVNSLRIWVSMVLFSEQVQWGWLNPERIHRIAGVCMYFISLIFFHEAIRKLVGTERVFAACKLVRLRISSWRGGGHALTPFFWYLGFVIGVPLLNGGWQKGKMEFVEHCLTVFAVTLVVLASFFVINNVYLQLRIGGNGRTEKQT